MTFNQKNHRLIKDTNNIIFGAYVGEGWKLNKKTYGSAETFLFTFKKGEIMQWGWKGDEEDQNYQFCDKEGIYVGISNGVGLYIKNDFYLGSSNICSTFNNEPLTKTEYFHIKEIELCNIIYNELGSQNQ
ncbi:hypothetical protein PPERSA_02917 [Pseudocohnilembus persalinus]|uniref:TLDc domain-containing protein n=1 Tax=Pseudocohnilembus persalinus TaxID=266149 RepID=A0A0V0QMP7_PSEPJ|nr:hypothetical protein PPERSA_02917 [Pseudocohnilembus persalinus]|eukprot:KRX03538.1 hypothetical protein PPERSA_02917 [Pseudocohnilembus persalinus]